MSGARNYPLRQQTPPKRGIERDALRIKDKAPNLMRGGGKKHPFPNEKKAQKEGNKKKKKVICEIINYPHAVFAVIFLPKKTLF